MEYWGVTGSGQDDILILRDILYKDDLYRFLKRPFWGQNPQLNEKAIWPVGL
jgi:hypothetical protein